MWVYTREGRKEITEIKELMKPFENLNFDEKIDIVKNLILIKNKAKLNPRHKRFLYKKKSNEFISKLSLILNFYNERGVLSTINWLKNIFFEKIFYKSYKVTHQKNIGLADEFLNPQEYFYDVIEFFELLNKNNLEIVHIVDGISKDLDDLTNNEVKINKNILSQSEDYKLRLIELFNKPRGIGLMCKLKK